MAAQEERVGAGGLRPLHVVQGNPYLATVTALSTDGNWLVTGCEDRSVVLLNARTGAVHRTLEGHEGAVKAIAISSSGQWVASAEAEIIKLWDVETGKSRDLIKRAGRFAFRGSRKNEGHLRVTSLAFSPDDETLVSVGPDRAGLDIKLWDVKTGSLSNEFGQDEASKAVFSPRGETVAAASESSTGGPEALRLWNVRTGVLKAGQIRQEGIIKDLSFSQNGRLLAVIGGQKGGIPTAVNVWDMATGKNVRSWETTRLFRDGPTGQVAVTCIAFAPDNDTLLLGGTTASQGVNSANYVVAHSVESAEALWEQTEPGLGLAALSVASDGLVCTATRHAVKVWQLF